MKIKNKKALSLINIVYLIITAITLILLVFFISNIFSDSNYKSSINECSIFLNKINGGRTFFNNLKSPNKNLLNSLGNICPSKTIKINKNQINQVTDLISNCYLESGKGVDFLPANFEGEGICLYCGSVSAKENINSFSKNIEKNLKNKKYSFLFKENSEFINLNSQTLNSNNIKNSLNSGEQISIFYYIFKPKSTSTVDQIQSYISSSFSQINPFTSFIAEKLSSSDIKTFNSIIITNQKKYLSNEILNKDRNSLNSKNCALIIPKKNYN